MSTGSFSQQMSHGGCECCDMFIKIMSECNWYKPSFCYQEMQRDGGNDGVDAFLRLLSPPGNKMEAAKRLAPAAGTFEFCGECQRVSALIEDGRANMVKSLMMLLTDDDRQEYGTSF